jgi:hypothetical protein
MVFNYYHRLSKARQRVYDKSDAITTIDLPNAAAMQALISPLEAALKDENRAAVQRLCQNLSDALMETFKLPAVRMEVLAARPSDDWGELHGLYTPEEEGKVARIQVWMRTAKHKRVVAFRSFLRTVLHELCHHLDYEMLRLPETFHTEGFYKRESSLFKQLVSTAAAPASE